MEGGIDKSAPRHTPVKIQIIENRQKAPSGKNGTNEKAPIANCREAGIIGPVTGLIGSMQVNEAIKEIALKDYQSSAGNLFLYDGLTLNIDKIKLVKNQYCPVCSK